jgi:hypothetical protein
MGSMALLLRRIRTILQFMVQRKCILAGLTLVIASWAVA